MNGIYSKHNNPVDLMCGLENYTKRSHGII